eukprot:SAG11_NODE_34716_length_270_cov_0.941520_1_plen_64_part_10
MPRPERSKTTDFHPYNAERWPIFLAQLSSPDPFTWCHPSELGPKTEAVALHHFAAEELHADPIT